MAPKDRVQVREPQHSTQLRPAAAPVDTYVRPAPVEQDNTWLALARGLAEVNPHVKKYIQDDTEDRRHAAEQWAQGRIAGMTHEEAKQAVAEGKLPEFDDPFKKAALTKYTGIVASSSAASDLVRRYNTDFDKVNGNVDDLIKTVYSEATKGFDGDRMFMAGFGKDWLGYAAKLRAQSMQDRTTENRVDAVDKVMGVFRTDIEKAAADGRLGDISRILDLRYKANASVLSVDKRTQDDVVWSLAQEYAAKGRRDVVETLLGHKGSDGVVLRDRAKYAPHADGLLNRAKDEAFKSGREAATDDRVEWYRKVDAGGLDEEQFKAWLGKPENRTKFKPEEVESMLRQDARHKLANAAKEKTEAANRDLDHAIIAQEDAAMAYGMRVGNNGTLSAVDRVRFFTKEDIKNGRSEPTGGWSPQEFRTKVVDRFLLKSQQQAEADRAGGMSEADAAQAQWDREYQWFAKNGINHPRWEAMLQSGAQAASLPTIAGEKDVSPVIQSAAEMYTRIWAQSPNMAAAMIRDRRSLEFYEAFRMASEVNGDKKHALMMAMSYTSDPTQLDKPEYRARLKDVEARIHGIGPAGLWPGQWGGTTPKNTSMLTYKVNDLAKFYAHWTSVEDAVRKAAEHVGRNIAVINGYAIPKPQGAEGSVVPPGFEKLIEARLQAFAKEHGKAHGFDADDLMIVPADNGFGAWKVVMAGTPFDPLPYGTKTMTPVIFTSKDLWSDYEGKQAADRAKAQFEAIHGEQHSQAYERLRKMSKPEWQGDPAIDPTSPLRPDLQRSLDERNKRVMDWFRGRSQDTQFKRNDQYPQQPPYTKP